MQIRVEKLETAYPGVGFSEPHMRASALGSAALDYLHACQLAKDSVIRVGPLSAFLLPTMHQTLELLSKAIVYKFDPSFNPLKYSHRVLALLGDYCTSVPVFKKILDDADSVDLLRCLEISYFGVRYGECFTSQDHDVWPHFLQITDLMFDELHTSTGVPYLVRHSSSTE